MACWLMRWRKPVSKVEREYVSVIAISGERSRKACATPLTMLAAPGRSQHRAGDFLLHQEKPHLSLARRFHQFHRFTAGVADDERRAGVPECGCEHFDSGGHGKRLPKIF